jgi:hypothetical protein
MNNYNEKYFSLSLRSAGKKSCFDFGLFTNKDIARFILGIPFLSYTLRS